MLNLMTFSNNKKGSMSFNPIRTWGGGHQHNLKNKPKEKVREFNKYISLTGGII